MIRKPRQVSPENLWNRLARDLIYDSKQVLLYSGIRIPEKKEKGAPVDYSGIVERITKGTRYGAIHDPTTRRIHFEPDYIQNIIDVQTRFDFPVYDKSFGPGGIAGYIADGYEEEYALKNPSLNNIITQALMAKKYRMPFAFVSARQLSQYEVEQIGVMTNVYEGPIYLHVTSPAGIAEVESFVRQGRYIITTHSIFDSPLTLTYKKQVDALIRCAELGIPVYLTTMPFSGQNGPMTTYGIALLAFAEFLAGMAIVHAVNSETKIINGAYPTMCTPGMNPELKIGSVAHNFVNYLVAYTSRLLDIPSIQSGCTIEGSSHRDEILGTDYQTVRAMLLWEDLFEGWHMLRHVYGFLGNLANFSFHKAENDIAALWHIQSLEDEGIAAVLANNVRLNRDFNRADEIYHNPKMLFDREQGAVVEVIIETMENYQGDFGRHNHTLKNIPSMWF
ncbi:MAG TPA: trimethylamine methyltransferase family protein [Desulfobacterales bacterium]